MTITAIVKYYMVSAQIWKANISLSFPSCWYADENCFYKEEKRARQNFMDGSRKMTQENIN